MIKLFGTVIIKIVGATGSFQRGHPEVFYNKVDLKNIFEAKFFTFWRMLQCVSGIQQSKICQLWIDFKLELAFDTVPATLKNDARVKSGQN